MFMITAMLKLFCLLLSICSIKGQQAATCVCDLTSSSCDVNCCCDGDCSPDDLSTFSFCLDTGSSPDRTRCIYDQVVFVNNIAEISQVRQNNFFCIQTDNFAERNFFSEPACVATNTCFDQIPSTYTFEVQQAFPGITGNVYRSGDPIYIVFDPSQTNFSTGYFSVFTNGISNFCQTSQIQYLKNVLSACTQLVPDSLPCSSNRALNGNFYFSGFKVAPNPEAFRNALNTTDPFNFPDLLSVRNTSQATCSDTSSSDLVTDVSYTFIVNGTQGIKDVSVDIRFTNTTASSVTQSFTVLFEFESANANSSQQRSGNPGYLVGRPIISGTNDNGVVMTNINTNAGITVVQSNANNECSNSVPILFGQDVRTGCKVPISSTCEELQRKINLILDKNNASSGNLVVASFGNTSSTKQDLNQWIPVLFENTTTACPTIDQTATATCPSVVVGAQYQFLYAYNGPISNPQAQIIGARLQYDCPQAVGSLCFSSTCNNAEQSVDVTLSVSFIDVSETPVTQFKAAPEFSAKLPNDFFFPFRSNSMCLKCGTNMLLLLTVINTVLLALPKAVAFLLMCE